MNEKVHALLESKLVTKWFHKYSISFLLVVVIVLSQLIIGSAFQILGKRYSCWLIH